MMEHFFGPVPDGLGVNERYCTEPRIPGSKVSRTYHVTFELIAGGDFVCTHCGDRFLQNDASASS